MTSTFESSIREIAFPQQSVYKMLSDLSNIEKVKDKIPQDKIQDLTFDTDSISVKSPLGAIQLNIIGREEPKCIKLETQKSPMPFNLWIQILPVSETSCKMKLTIKAEVNPFIKSMVQKPLQDGIEKIADALQMIQYE